MKSLALNLNSLKANGVEFRRTGDLAIVGTGSSNKNQSTDTGKYPFYVRSRDVYRIDNYEFDETAIVIPGEGGVGEIFHYVEGKYALHQRAYRIVFKPEIVLPKFAYYYFQTHFREFIKTKAVDGTVASIRKPMIEDFLMPILPIHVQKSVIDFFDQFFMLLDNLKSELVYREKQYKKYGDDFFGFLDDSNSHLIPLSQVAEIFDGVHQTPTYTNEGVRFVSVENITNLEGSTKYISIEDYDKLYRTKPKKGDLLMTRIGSVGKCAVIETEEPLAYYVSLALLKPDMRMTTSPYLKHYLESFSGKLELDKRTLHHAVPLKINLGEIGKISVRIPSLEMQSEIVKTLDLFSELTSSSKGGIRAEISLRERQLEYYRRALLTFDVVDRS